MPTISPPNNAFHLDLSNPWDTQHDHETEVVLEHSGDYTVIYSPVTAPPLGRLTKEQGWTHWLTAHFHVPDTAVHPIQDPDAGTPAGLLFTPSNGAVRYILVWDAADTRCWELMIARLPGSTLTAMLRIPSRNLSIPV